MLPLPKLGLLGAGIAVAGTIISLFQSSDDAREKLQETQENFKSLQSEAETLKDNLSSVKQQISELTSQKTLSLTDQQELANLQKKNDYLEKQIALQNILTNQSHSTATADTLNAVYKKSYSVAYTNGNNGLEYFSVNGEEDKSHSVNRLDAAQSRINAINDFNAEIAVLKKEMESASESDKATFQEQINDKKQQIANWQSELTSTLSSLSEDLSPLIDDQGNAIDPNNTDLVETVAQYKKLTDQYMALLPKSEQSIQNSIGGMFSKVKYSDIAQKITEGMKSNLTFEKAFEKFAGDSDLRSFMEQQGFSMDAVEQYFNEIVKAEETAAQDLRNNLIDTLSSPDSSVVDWIQKLSADDLQIAYEIVSNTDTSTWSLEDFQANLQKLKNQKLKIDYSLVLTNATEALDQINAALAKSFSGPGLNTNNISQLTSLFQDLEGFNTFDLFKTTSDGIHLNIDELRRLNQEYQENTAQTFYQNVNDAYTAWQNAVRSNANEEEISTLRSAYENATLLAAQYDGLTSSYQNWINASSNGEEGDKYDSYQKIFERGKELREAGLTGTEEFRAITDLLSSEDLTNASSDELANIFDNSLNLEKYFTEGREGIDQFLQDFQSKDGLFDTKAIAEELGTEEENIEALLAKARDYGEEVNSISHNNLQKGFLSIDAAAEGSSQNLNTLIKQFGELSNAGEDPSSYFDSITQALQNFRANGIDISDQIGQLNKLGETHGFYIDSSTLEIHYTADTSEVDSATEKATEVEEKEIEYKSNTSEIDQTNSELTKPETKEVVEQVQQIVTTVSTVTQGNETDTNLQATGTINYNLGTLPSLPTASAKVNYTLGVAPRYLPPITATVNYRVGFVQQPNGALTRYAPEVGGVGGVDGTAHSNGTIPTLSSRALALGGLTGLPSFSSAAYARGEWGTKRSEHALTGELGQELIVYGNRWWTVGDTGAEITHIPKGAIVFNHKQTEEILKNGYVTSGGGRGKAYASGTVSGAAYASGTASDAEDSFEELVDWIVRKLDVLKARTEQFLNAVESAVSVAAKKANFDAAFQNMAEHMRILTEAAARYQQQADSSGLSDEYKELVRSGRIDLETITDEDLKEAIDTFQDFYDKAQDCSDELVGLRDDIRNAAEDFANLRLEEAEEKIDRLDDAMSRLESAYKHSLSLTEKNNLLDQQTQNLKKQLEIYNATLVDANTQLAIQIGLLKNATGDQFLSAFEAKEKIDTSSLSGDTLILAEKYNALLTSSQEAYQKASEAADDYTDAIRENAKAKLENLQTDLENQNGLLDSKRSRYETQLDLLKARGDSIGSAYYQRMQEISEQERSSLEAANRKLQALLDKEVAQGTIVKGSEDWYDLTEQILDNANAIDGCTKNILEMQQAMDEIKWDHLERKLDAYQDLTDETDFLLDLLERQDLVDQSTGAYTEAGIASAGLMAQKLAIARQSMKEYQKALEDLDAAAAKSGANQMENSGYNAYMEKRKELMGDYRDAISDAYSYEDDMMSLIQDKLDAEADAYEEILDKRKEALKTAKEEAEYQKNIAEQTGNIQELERQLAALEGNDSDYAKKRRKQLKADLADAEEKLADTEAGKKYEIQVDVLDQDFEDFKASLDEYAKDTKTALGDLISEINSNVSTVQSSLETLAGETGYQISTVITDVWATAGNAVTSYSGTVADAGASVTARLEEMSNAYDEMAARVAQATESMLHSIAQQNEAVTKQNNGTIQSGQVNNGTNSGEVSAAVDKDKNYILGLYRDLLGREADAGGLASWLAAMASGMSAEEVRQGFLNSEEYRRMHGESGASDSANAVVTAKSGVNIRSSQSSSNSRNLLGALPNGTEVEILEDEGYWLKIRGGGLTGWAVSKWFRRYAAGTRRAGASSWAWTSDGNGDEIVISPSRRAVLTPVAAGDIIPNADLSRNLFAWGAYRPEDFIQGIGLPGHTLPAVSPVTNITIPIEAPLVRVDGIATDEVAARMTKQMDQQLKNFGRDMKKSIQSYTVRR